MIADPEPKPEPAPISSAAPEEKSIPKEGASSETPDEKDSASSSEPVQIGPPITVPLENASDTVTTSVVATSTTSSSLPLPEPPPPDSRFLVLSYSIDGQNWFELRRIGTDDWRSLTVDLPVRSWEDLKNVQIKITGTPSTLQTIPPVFLDGILVEVTSRMFELPSIFKKVSSDEVVFMPLNIVSAPEDSSSTKSYFLQFRENTSTVPEAETLVIDWCGAQGEDPLRQYNPDMCLGAGRTRAEVALEDENVVVRPVSPSGSSVTYTLLEEGKKLRLHVVLPQAGWGDLDRPFFLRLVLEHDSHFSSGESEESISFDEGVVKITNVEGGTLSRVLHDEPQPLRAGRVMNSFIFKLEKQEGEFPGVFTLELWKA